MIRVVSFFWPACLQKLFGITSFTFDVSETSNTNLCLPTFCVKWHETTNFISRSKLPVIESARLLLQSIVAFYHLPKTLF